MGLVRVSNVIGAISLWVSLVSYSFSLIFNLISFCAPDWIVYTFIPVKIGLWRLCDIQIVGYDRCADWTDRSYPSNETNMAFLGPPDFVRTVEGLEIAALVFYVIAGILIVLGICQRSMALLFFAAAMSMFISVVFLSATLGVFAGRGRSRNPGSLSYAWWVGLTGLIFSIISAATLTILSFYIEPPVNNNTLDTKNAIVYPGGTYSNGQPSELPNSYLSERPAGLVEF